jgi:Uncharacterized protein conserved in bacteria (DUF2252)
MRSAVDSILKFNRRFHPLSLKTKLDKMSSSAFVFFRGTFHLFARDMIDGPFRKWPVADAAGQIVGDLHTENFGTFRSITGEIVYDINDFDDTAPGPYEYDLRRLATSLIVGALDNRHPLSQGVAAAEACARGYLNTLARLSRLKTRAEFEHLKERKDVRAVLASAAECSRVTMLQGVVAETTPGAFVVRGKENYAPVSKKERGEVVRALPSYLKGCLAPQGSHPERYLEAGRRFLTMRFAIAVLLCGSIVPLFAADSMCQAPGQTLQDRAQSYLAAALAAGSDFVSVSSASGMPNLAPGSLATAFGNNLAPRTETGTAPYPTSLGGISFQVVDSTGAVRLAPMLYVSPTQINYLVPAATPVDHEHRKRYRQCSEQYQPDPDRRARPVYCERQRAGSGRRDCIPHSDSDQYSDPGAGLSVWRHAR